MKLNAGSGFTHKKGWINLDKIESCKPDIVADMEDSLPFKDNSFDRILLDNVLEHIDNIIGCMNELHRVIKPGGLLHVMVPQFPSYGSVADPTHKHYFIPQSFGYFIKEEKLPGIKPWKFYKNTKTFSTYKVYSDRGNETIIIDMKLEKA